MNKELHKLFMRDAIKLKEEIGAFENDDLLWQAPNGISNSAGNLCLHLVGNLNHFIGANLGGTRYVRQRELEFSTKNLPKAELLAKIDETNQMLDTVLGRLNLSNLEQPYPQPVGNIEAATTGYILMHLAAHLNYHLGQVNYLRRILAAK